jgi:hypothetical protein
MKLTEITFDKLKIEIESYLKKQYNKVDMLFTNASPYGQILSVVENLHQLSLAYLKQSLKYLDLGQNNGRNENIIRNAALFAGHIPGRAISATGTLKLTLKAGNDIEGNVPGSRMTMYNRTTIRNKTNGLNYSINLGAEKVTYTITNSSEIYIPIIQGKWALTTFTGTGEINQTLQLTIREKIDIENFNYEVSVNGEFWECKTDLYSMLPGEKACILRTGFNGGIDIIFGNNGYGMCPPIGANINVAYLLSNGASGSIFRRTVNDWSFVTYPIDGFGNTLDPTKSFDTQIYTDINFGADKEPIEFTRNVLPIVSSNFVIGMPKQFAYHIKRLGVFSHVNAYERDNGIYIVATPNIKLFKNKNTNYFDININAFTLDNYEKSKIVKYLKSGGNNVLSKSFQIDSPILSYYTMNVFIITYDNAIDADVNAQVYEVISEYFLNMTSMDRIAKVDLVTLISEISEIHSIDLSFVSKKNEDYHRSAKINANNITNEYANSETVKYENIIPSYDASKVLGIDPVLGDILFEPSELPIIRGGWYDRNSIYYSDAIDGVGLSSVNVIKKGTVSVKNKSKF